MNILWKTIRRILFLFDPELIHNITVFCLSLIRFGKVSISSSLEQSKLYFPNRVGLAAGLDKNAKALFAWQLLGFGFVEVGTVTCNPREGNPKPRISRDIKNKSIINRMGLPNDGIEKVLSRIDNAKRKGLRIPVGINITHVTEFPLIEYEYLLRCISDRVDYIVINLSCPNANSSTLDDIEIVLEELPNIIQVPVFLKVGPTLYPKTLEKLSNVVHKFDLAGVVATNSYPTVKGGLSGLKILIRSNEFTKQIREAIPDKIIIGCGGVVDTKSAQQKIDSGADMVQLYSGLIYEGPQLIKDVKGLYHAIKGSN